MPAHRRFVRSITLSALVAVLSLTTTPASAETLKASKYGSCVADHTMSGAAASPGAGYTEPSDSIKSEIVRIGPSSGYAKSWADAGFQCVPDPQPHENAKKIVITDVFRIDGSESISCDSTSITISWPPGITQTFCDSVSGKKIELSYKAASCKAKNGVPSCSNKYTQWTIEAGSGVKFFRYCRQTRAAFSGPTGNTVTLTAPPSIGSKCIVNENFFD